MWMSMIADAHDIHCDCKAPFAHLLDNIFPEGHTDRDKPISYIIQRDLKECLSGGDEEESHGIKLGESAATLDGEKIKEENLTLAEEEELEKLLAAVDEEPTR